MSQIHFHLNRSGKWKIFFTTAMPTCLNKISLRLGPCTNQVVDAGSKKTDTEVQTLPAISCQGRWTASRRNQKVGRVTCWSV